MEAPEIDQEETIDVFNLGIKMEEQGRTENEIAKGKQV